MSKTYRKATDEAYQSEIDENKSISRKHKGKRKLNKNQELEMLLNESDVSPFL